MVITTTEELETSGEARTGDDRARWTVTRTTRKDKPDEKGGKRETREGEKNGQGKREEVKADLGLMDECVFR